MIQKLGSGVTEFLYKIILTKRRFLIRRQNAIKDQQICNILQPCYSFARIPSILWVVSMELNER